MTWALLAQTVGVVTVTEAVAALIRWSRALHRRRAIAVMATPLPRPCAVCGDTYSGPACPQCGEALVALIRERLDQDAPIAPSIHA